MLNAALLDVYQWWRSHVRALRCAALVKRFLRFHQRSAATRGVSTNGP